MKPSEYALNDPIAAIATALVPSALGIVRASGKGAIELAAKCFSRPERLIEAEGNTLVHGWVLGPEAEGSRERVDEVMVAVYRAPKSFTGEDSVEIIGHGGTATVLAVYRALVASGFRAAERGEFTFRAFANGKTDLARSEAIREIVDAKTDLARGRAADRLSGSLSREIASIKNAFVAALAAIEVEIEYPEDEETTAGAFDASAIGSAIDGLSRLESAWAAGRLYRDGARIVLAGKTNAGKSSLFNALLKEDRAIVSDVHGTTRDWIESTADFAGIPVRLYDTAGLRAAEDAIEAEGVERSKELVSLADLTLYVVDGAEGLSPDDERFLSRGDLSAPTILVWNKADREGTLPIPNAGESLRFARAVALSAKRAMGLGALVEACAEILLGDRGRASGRRETAPGTERQRDAIASALASARHAMDAARDGFPMDAVAQDLEEAISFLGEITGEVTSADILDAVFSGFCVGK